MERWNMDLEMVINLDQLRNYKYENFPTTEFVKYLFKDMNYRKLYEYIKSKCNLDFILKIDADYLLELLPTKLVNEILDRLPKDIYDNVLKYAKYYYISEYGIKKYLDNEDNIDLLHKYVFVLIFKSHSMFLYEIGKLEIEG